MKTEHNKYNNLLKKPFFAGITAVFMLLFSISSPQSLQAQGGLDLTVTPPLTYLHVKPGSQSIHTITIENTGSQDLKITPNILDFGTDQDTGLPILLDKNSFEHFVSIEQQLQPIELGPTQKAQLTLVIAPPQNAPEKEYPLSIVFEAKASRDIPTQNSQLSGSVASNLIILISDKNEIAKQQIISDSGTPKIIDSFRALELKPIIKNESMATSIASGSATIKNMFGKEVATFKFFPDNILGFSQRPIRALDQTKIDSIQPTTFTYDPTLVVGPYTIEYNIESQDTTKTFKSVVIALPIFVLVAILAGFIVAFWYWRQDKNKNPFIK